MIQLVQKQVSPLDCTGCMLCVNTCNDDALEMIPFATEKGGNVDTALKHWTDSINNISNKREFINQINT